MLTPGDNNLAQWLGSLGLSMHAEAFEKNHVTFEVLCALSDADLRELGLSLGHRRTLMDAVGRLLPQRPSRASGSPQDPVEPGERRQITVMFCDLVGSTEMSARLDLDDLRSVIHGYYASCCTTIEDAGGFIARLIGDGILAYFGYPLAREDAAECAVRASLRILQNLGRERSDGGPQIKVRIGLATGMSVIGDVVGRRFVERHAVTGLTPNLASRIQALAAEGSVVVADETRRLAGGLFIYDDLGSHPIHGLDQPVQLWRVVAESGSSDRFEAHRTETFECLGRNAELDALQQRWDQARRGQGSIVTLIGEAGIGKSRLVRTARDRFAPATGTSVLLQCAPHQTDTPLHPLIVWIRREAGVGAGSDPSGLQPLTAWLGAGVAPLDLALVADLLALPMADATALPPMPPDRKHHLTREVLLRHFERLCAAGTVLLVLEDAHWMDGATEDFLQSLFQRVRDRPFMALVTTRPPHHRQWSDCGDVAEIPLAPLGRADAVQLLRNACGDRRLPPTIENLILAKTDGVPLFIEELTATVLESATLHGQDGTPDLEAALPQLAIPSTLRDSLTARLDRLDGAKDVARIASGLGREFSFSLLSHLCDLAPASLASALDRLVDAQLLFRRGTPPDADYVFKHALVQQAAYDGQLRSDRQALHARIVQAIETHRPEVAAAEPGLMAHHCQEAHLPQQQAAYLYAAGLASTRMVAIVQALSYFARAEKVMAGLPQSHAHTELHIDILLGMMEVGRFAILPERLIELGALAKRLAQRDGVTCAPATLSAILFQEGRALLYTSRYHEAQQIFTQIRQLGRDTQSPAIERKPASALGMNLCCQGLFRQTLEFVHEGNVDGYKQAGSFIDYISCLGWISYASCQMGPGDDGLRFGHLSVHEAELVESPVYLAGAYIWRSHAHMSVRRFDGAVADARSCVQLSKLHAVPYLTWHGLVFLALCLCRAGRLDEAVDALDEARALLAEVAHGQWSLLDYIPAIEAEIACARGADADAVSAATRAIGVAQALGGHFAEAMAWRVKAVCSLRAGTAPDQAQALFDPAVRLYQTGGAHAEQAFATLVWSHALQAAGHVAQARRWAAVAREQALRHGFDLAHCEYGAAVML